MVFRILERLLQYGNIAGRKAIPAALGLLYVSDPKAAILDILSRLSHDEDEEVAQSALMALGIVGAGTNNARLAGLLRNLSSYFYREPVMLFLVRIAQGIVHLGKGMLTINPYNTDKQLLSKVALSSVLIVLFSSLHFKTTLGGKHHYFLYFLVPAMYPRMLMTLDVEGKFIPATVRVGTAVDVVAQSGHPRSITGFQTYTTPVLLRVGERAELATNQFVPVTPILEGFVILKRDYEHPD